MCLNLFLYIREYRFLFLNIYIYTHIYIYIFVCMCARSLTFKVFNKAFLTCLYKIPTRRFWQCPIFPYLVLVFGPIQRQNLFWGGVGIHTTSAPSTAGTSTGAGALICKPGSARLETGSRPGAGHDSNSNCREIIRKKKSISIYNTSHAWGMVQDHGYVLCDWSMFECVHGRFSGNIRLHNTTVQPIAAFDFLTDLRWTGA